ncbi:hypothetical protein [Kordia jejudonensis]|uniref:hypothetical protein n=1 Tax=Kordia jejudonensis TaxID=1348245 RepID=UPI000629378B|nr:hypothetical protein [Kordia jejudonensis]
MKKILILLIGIQYCAFGQDFSKLKSELNTKFPNDSIVGDNVWAFYEEIANIKEIDKSIIKKYLNGSNIYQVTLTNYLGYHIEDADCLVIFNNKTSELELIPPIWFDRSMNDFFSKFFGKKFESKSELQKFISQMQDLMLTGSVRKNFENTKFESNKISFDLIETRKSKKKVWRKMEIEIKDNVMIDFIKEK